VRRRMLASLVLGVGLTLIGPGAALAEAGLRIDQPMRRLPLWDICGVALKSTDREEARHAG